MKLFRVILSVPDGQERTSSVFTTADGWDGWDLSLDPATGLVPVARAAEPFKPCGEARVVHVSRALECSEAPPS